MRKANRARMGAAFRNRFGIGPPPLRTVQKKVRKYWDKKEIVMHAIAKKNRNQCDGFEDKDFDRRWTNADERNQKTELAKMRRDNLEHQRIENCMNK
jgi:hypothetical protein